jgi:rod shape-determining protein MreC
MRISLKKNKIWIIILAILILALLNLYQEEVKSSFYSFSEPFQKFFWKMGQKTSNFFETIFEIRNLKKELDNLKLENQKLLSEIAFLKELKRENETLRQALEIGLEKEYKLAFAEIISKDINGDSILINKGREDGISENLAVITESKVLIGEISEVSHNFSRVLLISDKRSSLDAKIQDKEVQGVLKGQGGGSLTLGLLPQDKEIQEGDLIVTTSLGGLPKGLLVGKVEKVIKSDIKPVQEAEVLPLFDLSQVERVFIILDF